MPVTVTGIKRLPQLDSFLNHQNCHHLSHAVVEKVIVVSDAVIKYSLRSKFINDTSTSCLCLAAAQQQNLSYHFLIVN